MCRMVVFAGHCTICAEYFAWDELSQELSCLEAKNNGIFGDCRKGVGIEEHDFDQECDACADYENADEGIEIEIDTDPQPLEEDSKGKAVDYGNGNEGRPREHDTSSRDDERNRKRQRTS